MLYRYALLAAAAAMLPAAALAQAAQPEAAQTLQSETAPWTREDLGAAIVVTGRVNRGDLRKAEAAYAITVLDDSRLRQEAPLSVADIFRNVPGFWVESSGGEAANNIRARGIPRDGYSSVGFHEDGLPVQHDPGLGFLNADQSFRFDETYGRVEAVRGGPASIVASNAPGGLVNFITRRGGQAFEALGKVTVGEYGLARGDVWLGGPIAADWTASVGGFFRYDEGIRPTDFPANRGGQIRANIEGEIGGALKVFADVKHIADRVAFFLPVPLTFDRGGNVRGVPGFSAQFGTVAGEPTDDLTFRSVFGDVPFDLDEGTRTDLTQGTLVLDIDLGRGFAFHNGLRVRQSDIVRNGLFPAAVVRANDRLTQFRGATVGRIPGVTGVELRYADDGSRFDPATANGNGLVLDATASAVNIRLDEIINDFRLTGEIEAGGRHSFALGLYHADFFLSFDRYGSTVLLEANENARRLDLVATNAAGGAVFRGTDNGISRYGNQYNNGESRSDVVALYATDEWSIGDKFRLDGGVRWERLSFRGFAESAVSRNLGDATTSADDNALSPGTAARFARDFDDFGWTVGANYQFDRQFGLFGRYTKSFRLPNATDFLGTAVRTDLVIEDIDLAEVGVKFSRPFLDLYVTGFYTYFSGVRFTSNEFNPATGGFIERVEFADTETFGVEAEGIVRPAPWADLAFNVTYQVPEFRNFRFTERGPTGAPVQRDFSGNQLLRVPELALRFIPGVNLAGGRLRAQAVVEHFTRRFADAANTVELPPYTLLGASVRFAVTPRIELFAFGDNLTNAIGLTEGNPRAGQFAAGDAGAQFFLARPVFGRNFRAAALFRF